MADGLWDDDPELQARYERVVSNIRRLQQELGIEPLTLEQRYQRYLKRKAEEEEKLRQLKELERLRSQMPVRRSFSKIVTKL